MSIEKEYPPPPTPREIKFLEEIERLNAYVEEWKRRYETARLAHEESREEIERLKIDVEHWQCEDANGVALIQHLSVEVELLWQRIVTLEGMLGEMNIAVPEWKQ
jgi:hypothetical protein